MAVITSSGKVSVSRIASDAAIKTIVKKAGGKTVTVADVKATAKATAEAWAVLHGILSQEGAYKGKRFKGAKDHSPEANLEVLAVAVATGLMPEIVA